MSKYTKNLEYQVSLAGTYFYMAPEVLQGRYTFHCDMWSFGVVMFIMLFGFPPFHGSSDEIIHKQIEQGFNPITKKGYGPWFPNSIEVSKEAKDLISKCLHSDPTIRLSAYEAKNHPWFLDPNDNPLANTVLRSLNSFTKNSKFKHMILNALSTSLSSDELIELKKSFIKMDLNKDGVISIDELKESLNTGIANQDEIDNIKHIMNNFDVDGDGVLSYEELVLASVNQRLREKEDRLYNTFCQLDIDNDGTVTADEIKTVLGDNLEGDETMQQIQDMIAEVDQDGDGSINYEEFVSVFLKKKKLKPLGN